MTEPEELAPVSAPEIEEDTGAPIPVRMVGGTQVSAPEFGSLRTFVIAGTSPPQQILAQNDNRDQARILVYAGTGAAATAYVQVGSRQQVMNNVGGQLLPGTNLEIKTSQEFWLGSDGSNTMIVTVLDERYA
jgi:hypothetical protein